MWAIRPIVGTFAAAVCDGGTLPGTVANTYPHSSIAASAQPSAASSSRRIAARAFCFPVEGLAVEFSSDWVSTCT